MKVGKGMIFLLWIVSLFMVAGIAMGKSDYDKQQRSSTKEWTEGKEVFVDQRGKFLIACKQGIKGQGYSDRQTSLFCECMVDYLAETSTKYSKDELVKIGKERGNMNFMMKDAHEECGYHLNT